MLVVKRTTNGAAISEVEKDMKSTSPSLTNFVTFEDLNHTLGNNLSYFFLFL